MTTYAKGKLKYSRNENFNYVEWDRFVTLAGAKADWGLRGTTDRDMEQLDFKISEYPNLLKWSRSSRFKKNAYAFDAVR